MHSRAALLYDTTLTPALKVQHVRFEPLPPLRLEEQAGSRSATLKRQPLPQ